MTAAFRRLICRSTPEKKASHQMQSDVEKGVASICLALRVNNYTEHKSGKLYKVKFAFQHSPTNGSVQRVLCRHTNEQHGPNKWQASKRNFLENCIFTERDNFSYLQFFGVVGTGMYSRNLLSFPGYFRFPQFTCFLAAVLVVPGSWVGRYGTHNNKIEATG